MTAVDLCDGACRSRAVPWANDDDEQLHRSLVAVLRRSFGTAIDAEAIAGDAIAGFAEASVRTFVPILAQRRALELARGAAALSGSHA